MRPLGSMLDRESGSRGLNFLTDEIFQVARRRIGTRHGTVDEYRLLHNLLSSQPMCFNLFGPFVADHDLATRVFRHLFSETVSRVLDVQIEYAPEPAAEYLDDRTAFDAFIEYEHVDGKRAFVGVETKLIEPFSPQHYDGPKYRRWVERPDSPWPEETWGQLDAISHNQLWRDHLLAFALCRHPSSPYAHGQLMLVAPRADEASWSAAEAYRHLVSADDRSFMQFDLEEFVDGIAAAPLRTDEQNWLRDFRRRYVDLTESEAARRNAESHVC
jgi:hypothetical protein